MSYSPNDNAWLQAVFPQSKEQGAFFFFAGNHLIADEETRLFKRAQG